MGLIFFFSGSSKKSNVIFLSVSSFKKNLCNNHRGQNLLRRKSIKNRQALIHLGSILTSIPRLSRPTYSRSSINLRRIDHNPGHATRKVALPPSGEKWDYLSTEGWQSGCSSWGNRYVIPTTPTTRRVKGPTCTGLRTRELEAFYWKAKHTGSV